MAESDPNIHLILQQKEMTIQNQQDLINSMQLNMQNSKDLHNKQQTENEKIIAQQMQIIT